MMSLSAIVLELVQNVSLFAAVVVGYAAIRRRADLAPWAHDILVGLIFAAGTVLAMSLRVQLAPGIVLDARSVLTGSVAFFAGPVGSLITLSITAAYRYWIGGAGANGGVIGVAVAGTIGQIFFFATRHNGWATKPLTFLLLGLAVVTCNTILFYVLNLEMALSAPEGLIPAIFAVIPVSTMIFALMLQREDARVALQRKLADQTALFEAIFHSMSDGVTVADAKGNIILTNQMSEKLAGVRPNDTPPEEWAEAFGVYLSDGASKFPAEHMPLVRAIRGEATDDIEMIVENSYNGHRRRLSVSGRPLKNAKGQSQGGIVVFRDNTDQREMQESLRRSEERFAMAIAGSRDGIFDYNPVTGQVWFSPRYKAILGYSDNEFPNEMGFWKSRMLPEDHKTTTEQFFAYEKGEIDTIEIRQRFRHRDGSIVHVQNRAQGTRDEQGRVSRLVGAITDITPLIKAEQRLKEAIGAMESGFALFDAEDRLVICNEGFIDPGTKARFGVPIGRTFEEIFQTFAEGRMTAVNARNNPGSWLNWRMEMHRNPPKEPLEIQWTDGRWMRVTERRTADGGSVGVWTDITAQKAAEAQLRDAIDSINEGFALFDKSLRFIICNQRYREQYPVSAEIIRPGVSLADVLRYGAANGEYAGISARQEIDDFVNQWIQRYNCTFPFVQEVANNDGRWLLISHQRTATGGFVTLRTDITAQKRREQELRDVQDRMKEQAEELGRYVAHVEEARERIENQAADQVQLMEDLHESQRETQRAHLEMQQAATVLRSMTDNIPVLVADVDAEGYYRYCNHRYLHFFGRTAEATIGKHLRDVYGEEMFTSTVAPDLAWVMQGQEVAFTRTLKSGGDIRHLEGKYIPQIDASGQVNGFFKAAWDVTEQHEREQQLSREVSTDALTGTLNRRAILAAIQGLPLRFSHGSAGAALLYLDVDHFKQINDTFGHAGGDQLLKTFAQRLRHVVRASDMVSRLGGDEFVVLLVDVANVGIAERVAQKILTQMQEPVDLDGRTIRISTSIGIAWRSRSAASDRLKDEAGGGQAIGDLLAEADAALYQAKAAGRGTYRVFPGGQAAAANG